MFKGGKQKDGDSFVSSVEIQRKAGWLCFGHRGGNEASPTGQIVRLCTGYLNWAISILTRRAPTSHVAVCHHTHRFHPKWTWVLNCRDWHIHSWVVAKKTNNNRSTMSTKDASKRFPQRVPEIWRMTPVTAVTLSQNHVNVEAFQWVQFGLLPTDAGVLARFVLCESRQSNSGAD